MKPIKNKYCDHIEYRLSNGKLHRDDGPAIEYSDGGKEYYYHGKHHREDGPAIEWNGDKSYWVNGKRHREDGPAVILEDGTKEYWINGNHLTKKQYDMYSFINAII